MTDQRPLEGRSVLVVDDARFSLQIVAQQLSGQGLAHLAFARNGDEGLQAIVESEFPFDLVISDVKMPVMHGLCFIKAVREGARGIPRSLPFAMAIGQPDSHLVELALSLDVNAFLIKPVSKNGLISRLSRMLDDARCEGWLKPLEYYATVGVPSRLEDVAEPDTGTGEMSVGQSAARRLEVDGSGPSSGGPDGGKPAGARRATLDTVPENAVLARDLRTGSGMVLAAAGTMVSAGMISLLNDARELGHSIGDLWVVPNATR